MKSLVKTQEQVAGPKHCLNHAGEPMIDRCGLHSFKSNYYSNSHRRMQRDRQPFTFPPMSNLESSNIHHLFAITSFQNISIPRSCKVNNRSQSQMLVPGGLLPPPLIHWDIPFWEAQSQARKEPEKW